MKTNTKYALYIDGTATDYVRSTKATVVAEAEKVRKGGERALIEVRTQTGHVAFALKAIKARVITKKTKAFTKTIDLPEALQALVPSGYVAAYERPRNDALVLRNEDAEDASRYLVTRRSTGDSVAYAPTTRAAGAIMKGMKVGANA